ncbi:putative gamma-glutamylcyclotransferase [Hypsibius exemplaris]|uniref:Gamma-glutamylcyclotransferase family protein n=1 Tax=Hypsibius exemplaris TaxID=2072580 RepID=A0A1W0WHA1_HYPEX|nr:putative gamma-glutamylcyclotransferase [Hypsibius exemplaris]
MGRHLVFVYGTLKAGEPNHDFLQPPHDAVFIGKGATVERFPLVIASRYNIPFVLDAVGQGNRIQGEVYEVDDNTLADLDELEKHPDYYKRRPTRIELFNPSATVLECGMYFLHGFHERLLTLPRYDNYSSAGAHGLPFQFRNDHVSDPLNPYSTIDDVKNDIE